MAKAKLTAKTPPSEGSWHGDRCRRKPRNAFRQHQHNADKPGSEIQINAFGQHQHIACLADLPKVSIM
jgi:hypothetical protein